MRWQTFNDILASDEVTQLASGMFGAATVGEHNLRFTALTVLCCAALPEGELKAPEKLGAGGPHRPEVLGTASSGACVFYVEQLDNGAGTGAYDPWTLEVFLGASASYTFAPLDGSPEGIHESDSEPWRQSTMALLERSVWRRLQPASAHGLP